MRLIIPFVILFLAVILQATFLIRIAIAGVFLNVVLVLLLCSVFFGKRYQMTMLAAFLSGLLLDCLSGLPFGYLAVVTVAVIFLSFALLSFVLRDSFWHWIFFVALGTALYYVVLTGVLLLARKTIVVSAGFPALGSALAIELALNVAAAFPLYFMRKWIIL